MSHPRISAKRPQRGAVGSLAENKQPNRRLDLLNERRRAEFPCRARRNASADHRSRQRPSRPGSFGVRQNSPPAPRENLRGPLRRKCRCCHCIQSEDACRSSSTTAPRRASLPKRAAPLPPPGSRRSASRRSRHPHRSACARPAGDNSSRASAPASPERTVLRDEVRTTEGYVPNFSHRIRAFNSAG